MTDLRRVTRALLSVSDKTGLVEFARALAEPRRRAGLDRRHGARRSPTPASTVSDVAELTGFPEMMDGRVKTLHPKVHGGLLGDPRQSRARRRDGRRTASRRSISLVVNLYPFEATVAKGADYDDCIENIDIGGPAMIRAAAKNHADVAVVVEPEDYAALLAELEHARRRDHAGAAQEARRQGLCAHRGL